MLVQEENVQNSVPTINENLLKYYYQNTCMVIESLTPECKKFDLMQNEMVENTLGVQVKMEKPVHSASTRSPSNALTRNMQKNMNVYNYFTEKIEIERTAKKMLTFSIIHVIGVIYTTLMLPVYVCFDVHDSVSMLLAEAILHFECLIFVYLSTKTYLSFKASFSTKKMKKIALKYVSVREIAIDFLGILPLNLALSSLGSSSMVISLLRLTRMVMILRLNPLLDKIEYRHRSISQSILILKSIIILIYVWHWTACLWFYFNLQMEKNKEDSWIFQNKLLPEGTFIRYIYAMLFTLNIATTTGYPEQIVFNERERVLLIIIVYIGNALFSLSFGILSSFVSILPEQYTEIFESSTKISLILNNYSLPHKLRKKIDKYIIYLISLKSSKKSQLGSIKNILSNHLYEEFMYGQVKPLLLKLPVFSELSPYFLKEISKLLLFSIYLPDDYIIYKDDSAEEMFFIVEGSVNILSPDEIHVIKKLEKGNYFGEIALFIPNTRRICSVVAAEFCQLYRLNSLSLEAIGSLHPNFAEMFIKVGSQRLEEYKKDQHELHKKEKVQREINRLTEKDIHPNKIQHFSKKIKRFSVDSSSSIVPPKTLIHLPESPIKRNKFTGISESQDNSDEENSLNEYIGPDEFGINKQLQSRRVICSKNRERRHSRKSLGKDLILSKFSGLSMQWGLTNND